MTKSLRPFAPVVPARLSWVLIALFMVWSSTAIAQSSYSVLYSFCSQTNCTDGSQPFPGSLIRNANGDFYGTTEVGGKNWGTVYQLTALGSQTVLYDFCSLINCADGNAPSGPIVQDSAGNIYGTTQNGGSSAGYGVVFRVDPLGNETVLYNFCSQSFCDDGGLPLGLIQGSSGNFYGVAASGGSTGGGVVFSVTPSGTETVLYAFCPGGYPCRDGAVPFGALIQDSAGNLFGTTVGGGNKSSGGVVFRVTPSGAETVLYHFCSLSRCTDGASPAGGVVQDKAGNLYGVTQSGGKYDKGVLFRIDPSGKETVLHSFCSLPGCADGANPNSGVLLGAGGNLYGSTSAGGNSSNSGVVFRYSLSAQTNKGTVLYTFCSQPNCTDGAQPESLIQDAVGNLYGTTGHGGITTSTAINGAGVVFEIAGPN